MGSKIPLVKKELAFSWRFLEQSFEIRFVLIINGCNVGVDDEMMLDDIVLWFILMNGA